jgi:hypothetical protein
MLLSALFICFVGWLTGQLEFMATLGIGQPALELATAFPQATPASIFPPLVIPFVPIRAIFNSRLPVGNHFSTNLWLQRDWA